MQRELLSSGHIRLRSNDFVRRTVRLRRPVDQGRLARALERCLVRHRLLTATFSSPDDPHIVLSAFRPVWEDLDRFEDRSPPLFDTRLFAAQTRPTEDGTLISLCANHAIMDARSMSILFRDLFVAYDSDSPLNEQDASVSYGDWTEWERANLSSPRGQRLRDFWVRRLGELGPLPASGFASVLPRVERTAACQFNLTFDVPATQFLAGAAATAGGSLFAAIGVVWKVALWAMRVERGVSESAPVAVLGAFANRLPARFAQEVGGFANSVVIVTDIRPSLTFVELVANESKGLVASSFHQDYPHSNVTLDLDPRLYAVRYAGRLGDIPRYVNFDIPYAQGVGFPEGVASGQAVVRETAAQMPRGGLRIVVAERDGKWTFDGRYDPSVYGFEVIAELTTRVRSVLARWMSNPNLPAWRVVEAMALDAE